MTRSMRRLTAAVLAAAWVPAAEAQQFSAPDFQATLQLARAAFGGFQIEIGRPQAPRPPEAPRPPRRPEIPEPGPVRELPEHGRNGRRRRGERERRREGPPERRPGAFERYEGGDYVFESDAQAAMQERLAGLERAGFSVLGGSVFRRDSSPWRYYFVIEYVERGDRWGGSPALERFEHGAFTFESDAAAALAEYKAGLSEAGVGVIGGSVFRRDSSPWRYYFVLEYAGERRPLRLAEYQGGDYTFESDAAAAMAQRKDGLRRAGIAVAGGTVFRRDSSPWRYSFTIHYLEDGRGRRY